MGTIDHHGPWEHLPDAVLSHVFKTLPCESFTEDFQGSRSACKSFKALVDNAATRLDLRLTGRVTTLQPQRTKALGSLLSSRPNLEVLRVRVYQKAKLVRGGGFLTTPFPLHALRSFCAKLGGNIPKVSKLWLSGHQVWVDGSSSACALDTVLAKHILKAVEGPLTSLSLDADASLFDDPELLGSCFPQLQTLEMSEHMVSSIDFCTRLPKLQHLHMHVHDSTSLATLSALTALQGLRINLGGRTGLDGLGQLSSSVRELRLVSYTAVDVSHLSVLTGLECLGLSLAGVCCTGTLRSLTGLTSFSMSSRGSQWTDILSLDCSIFTALVSLRSLHLHRHCNIDFAIAGELEELTLSHVTITPAGWVAINSLHTLRKLNLTHANGVTAINVRELSQLTNLTAICGLSVRGRPASIKALKKSLPMLLFVKGGDDKPWSCESYMSYHKAV